MPTDLVYRFVSSAWNQELRYSLRSFYKNFSDLGTVWIFGELPDYIDPSTVKHLPAPQMFRPGIYLHSTARRLINDKLKSEVDQYIFCDDDQYLCRPTGVESFRPLWVEDMDQLLYRGDSDWQLALWHTYDILKFLNFPGINYEAHTPVLIDSSRYKEISDQFIYCEQAAKQCSSDICGLTAYFNMTEMPHQGWANDHRAGFVDPDCAKSKKMIEHRLFEKTFLFHDDAGLTGALKDFIKDYFDEPSPFEFQ
jgi:hypothetical protein